MEDKITVEVVVEKGLEGVWTAYTQPEHITGWNFADASWHCPWASNDLRPGGTYAARMEARDASAGFMLEGVTEEVVPGERWVYGFDGRRVEVSFAAEGAGTRVTLHFDPENVHPRDLQQAGWQAILDSFKRYAEGKE
jgi:uncharacterized protein YndB with AHSA1/START domain